MKVDVDNENREIYIDGVKAHVTWKDLEDERRKHEYGISIVCEARHDIRWSIIRQFKIVSKSEQIALSFLLILKLKLKWDCDDD